MTKTLGRLLLFAFACVLFTALVFAFAFIPTAEADAPVYVNATIEFGDVAYVDSDYDVKARVWTRGSSGDWAVVDMATFPVGTEFYNESGEKIAEKPKTAGAYTVKLVLTSAAEGKTYRTSTGESLAVGDVIASLQYRVVNGNAVSVVFAPSGNLTYTGANLYNDNVKDQTQVYRNGTLVTDEYNVSVQNSGGVVTTDVIDPGAYHVEVVNKTNAEEKYVSTFYVVRDISGMIGLAKTVFYEGMGSSAPTFTGSLASEGDKFEVTYWSGSTKYDEAPTTAGSYVCRVKVKTAVANLSVGDYVDLPYTIKPIPYQVIWNQPIDSVSGKMNIKYSASVGMSVGVDRFVLRADPTRTVGLSLVQENIGGVYYPKATYYDIDNKKVDTLGLGVYTVKYTIDLSKAEGGVITGKDYFGEADASYVINDDNAVISQTFEVINNYEVEGIRSTYYSAKTDYARAYLNRAENKGKLFAVSALRPAFKSNSIYYDDDKVSSGMVFKKDGNNKFDDDTLVTLASIKSKQEPGHYTCELTFGDWSVTDEGGNTTPIVSAGAKYHFEFDIVTVPIDGLSVDAETNAAAVDAVTGDSDDALLKKLGIRDNVDDCDITYYQFTDGRYTVINSENLCTSVGKYAARVEVKTGTYKDRCFVLVINKKSSLSVEEIEFEIPGLNAFKQIDYTGTAVAAAIAVESGVDYSLYYQRYDLNTKKWDICAYPVKPGKYRAVFRFNAPSDVYNVAYGYELYYEYEIKTLSLTAKASFGEEATYSGKAQTANISFYVNGMPLYDADYEQDFKSEYTVYYRSTTKEGSFTKTAPIGADTYAVGVLFTTGDHDAYGYPTVTEEDFATALETNASGSGYLLRCDENITIDPLLLDVEVTIEDAFYSGTEIEPTFAFYKGEMTLEAYFKTFDAEYVYHFEDYFTQTLYWTKFGNESTLASVVESAIKTGQYDLLLSIKDKTNIKFNQVTGSGSEITENGDLSTIFYVNPKPLFVSVWEEGVVSPTDETNKYVGYYGNVDWRETSDLVFHALGESDIAAMRDYITLTYSKRDPRTDTLVAVSSQDESNLVDVGTKKMFASGSYNLRIMFKAPQDDAVLETYSQYCLVGGTDTEARGLLQEGCYLDIRFDVENAKPMRVVFTPRFESYSYKFGENKYFDVRFMSGLKDVTSEFEEGEGKDYMVNKYGHAELSDAMGNSGEDTAYTLTVTFLNTNNRYYIGQYVGEYTETGNTTNIPANAIVSYTFVVTRTRNMSWAWDTDSGDTSFVYNGKSHAMTLDFVNEIEYDAHAANVTLVKGTDYDIWYYDVVESDAGTKYSKRLTVPSEPGRYVAELVFLRDLTDYRYRLKGTDKVVYSYIKANRDFVSSTEASDAYLFGRSLNVSGIVLENEGRYLQYEIVRGVLEIKGLTAQNKPFDNSPDAVVSQSLPLSERNATAIDESKITALRSLLQQAFVGKFETVGVGENNVYYHLDLGDGILLRMPHATLCVNLGKTGVAYLSEQLADIDRTDLSAATIAKIDAVTAAVEQFESYYDLYFADVKATISKNSVSVIAQNVSRTYDPNYPKDEDLLFSLSDRDRAKLEAVKRLDGDAAYFVGKLVREHADVPSINSEGYKIIADDTFGFIADDMVLADGVTHSKLADLFDLHVTGARYYINPVPLVIAVDAEDDHIKVQYSKEKDSDIRYVVLRGDLRDGDELRYIGTMEQKREHDAAHVQDDVGVYNVLFDRELLRIYRYGEDVTANYTYTYRPAKFEIVPMTVVLSPNFTKKDKNGNALNHYVMDEFIPEDVGVSPEFTALCETIGIKIVDLYQSFGRVEIDEKINDPKVYKRYNIIKKTIMVTDADDNDVSANFSFVIDPYTEVYEVKRYAVNLKVTGDAPVKKFGDPDPIVKLEDKDNSLEENLFLAATSLLTREEGENVGVYLYSFGNEMGNIRVMYKTKDMKEATDVTDYCTITIYNGDRRLSDYYLKIVPLDVTVTVRNETFNYTGRSITPEIIYLKEDGTSVSAAIIAKRKVNFLIPKTWMPKEGVNDDVTPVADGDIDSDENFNFIIEPGTITVIFPNNVVTVTPIPEDDRIASANKYAFVGGVLYRTVQLYAAETLDGGEPDHTVTVSLPVTENMYGEDVYIIAVRKDGSYVMRQATIDGSEIEIVDDEFYYIIAAQPEYWPYYLIAGGVVLIAVGIVVAVLRSRKRFKVRGKKEKPVKKKKKEEPQEGDKTEPQETRSDEDVGQDDLLEDEDDNSEQEQEDDTQSEEGDEEKSLPQQDAEQSVPSLLEMDPDADKPVESAENGSNPPKEEVKSDDKKSRKEAKEQAKKAEKKEQKPDKKEKKKDKKDVKPMGYMPNMAAPSTPKPKTTPPPLADDSDTLVIPVTSDNDDIIIGGGSNSSGFGGIGGNADDDEIIISSTSRRFEDNDD